MFSWLPRWHPFVWAFVIVMIILIWDNPAQWGHTVGGWIHYIPLIAQHVGTFFSNI